MNESDGLPDMQQLVARLGPHPATALGLDLETGSGRAAWWVAAIVLSAAGGEERSLGAFRRLRDAGGGEFYSHRLGDAHEAGHILQRYALTPRYS